MEKVNHLVLSGGALKGIAFLGALECLQRRQGLCLDNLQVLVGSSIGSLIAALISIGYTTAQLFKITIDTNVAELAKPELGKLLTRYGLDSGHKVVEKIRDTFRVKGVDPNITLKEHYAYTGKRLVLTVSCLGKGVRYIDYTNQPELSVISAIRMSISLPGYFTPVRYQNDYYVDGGMLDNVPIDFLSHVPLEQIVVIRTSIVPYEQRNPEEDTLETYLYLLWLTNTREMERLRLESKQTNRDIHRRATIHITITPMSSPITLTTADKKTLLRDGYVAAMNYLTSDIWLAQRIDRLPYRVLRNVWREVHRRSFKKVVAKITPMA
jgi:predicted acylesterase/phospholipase RssA